VRPAVRVPERVLILRPGEVKRKGASIAMSACVYFENVFTHFDARWQFSLGSLFSSPVSNFVWSTSMPDGNFRSGRYFFPLAF
jgi:hypothetical protein